MRRSSLREAGLKSGLSTFLMSISYSASQEDLRDEQPVVLAEGERIGPAHAVGDLDDLAVGPTNIDLAHEERRPGHRAVFGEGDVVSHAGRLADETVDLARID